MPLPTLDQYNDAVQNAGTAFADGLLKMGRVQRNGMGLPLAMSGGFALTYNLTCRDGSQFAIRCFHRATDHLEQRYHQISRHLLGAGSSYFLKCDYQPKGVKIGTETFPIVKMEWSKGTPLGTYLERNYSDANLLTGLRHKFEALAAYLRRHGIAHGDLQNGNVMVEGENIRLIDYDGMYVGGMPIGSGTELGHKHFQHPRRTPNNFGPDIDRFSFIVIDFSLDALSSMPKLFETYSNGENIIFTANDFAQPQQSPLFQSLLTQPALKAKAERFAEICANDICHVPFLDDFQRSVSTAGMPLAVYSAPNAHHNRANYIGALPVFSGEDYAGVGMNVGNRIEVIGKIVNVRMRRTIPTKPYVFLDFGSPQGNIVKVNIWSEGLSKLRNPPDSSWIGKWVSVTGLVDAPYDRYGYTQLSVTVNEQSQLHVIVQGEAEYRLGVHPVIEDRSIAPSALPPNVLPRRPTLPAMPPVSVPVADHNQQTLERIRQTRIATTTQTTPQSSGGATPVKSGWLSWFGWRKG